jgi:hypothetical protein
MHHVLKIKPRPKNVWQSPKNPLTHPICISHMWPKCNLEESLCLERSLVHFKTCTLTLSPTKTNWVKRWSKVQVISLIGFQLHWRWFFIIQEMWKTQLTNNNVIISLHFFQEHKGGSLILWIKGVELTSLIHLILKSNLEILKLIIYKDKFLSMTFHLSTQFVWMR